MVYLIGSLKMAKHWDLAGVTCQRDFHWAFDWSQNGAKSLSLIGPKLTEKQQNHCTYSTYYILITCHHSSLTDITNYLCFQMMRAYPSSIAQHAINAAKVLIKYEQQQGSKLGSINPLRKMLILELMPLILSKGKKFNFLLVSWGLVNFFMLPHLALLHLGRYPRSFY